MWQQEASGRSGTSGPLADVVGIRKHRLGPPSLPHETTRPNCLETQDKSGQSSLFRFTQKIHWCKCCWLPSAAVSRPRLFTHDFLLGVSTQAALVRMVLTQVSGSPQGSFPFFPPARRLEGETPQRRSWSLRGEEVTKATTLFQGPYDLMARWTVHSKVLETLPGFSLYLEGGLS